MVFRRRKSSSATLPVEIEQRSRNVLSKPPTSRSTTNLTSSSKTDSTVTSRNNSIAPLGTPLSNHSSNPEARQVIRSQIFGTQSTESLASSTQQSKSNLVALLVSQYEAKEKRGPGSDTSESRSRSPTRRIPETPSSWGPTAPTDAVRASLHSNRSGNRRSPLKETPTYSLSPASSQDRISELSSVPTSRRASFVPGAATRKEIPSLPVLQKETKAEDQWPQFDVPTIATEDVDPKPDWTPPARVARSSTPTDLDYTHLGPLRLGSLHVTNGRASPAFSDLSRLGFTQLTNEAHRDMSSDYGGSQVADSCTVSREPSKLEVNNNNTSLHRNFSWQSTYTDDKVAESVVEDDRPVTPVRDNPTFMAMEYMAELPESPYSEKKSIPLSRASSPLKDIHDQAPDGSQQLSYELEPSSPFPETAELIEPFDSPLARTLSSSGSIVRVRSEDFFDGNLADQIFGTNPVYDESGAHSWEPLMKLAASSRGQLSAPVVADHFQDTRPQSSAAGTVNIDSGYGSNMSTISTSAEYKAKLDPPGSVQEENFVPPKLKTSKTEPILSKFSLFKSKSNPNLRDMQDLKPKKNKRKKDKKEKDVQKVNKDLDGNSRNRLQKKAPQLAKGVDVTVQSVQPIDSTVVPDIPSHVRRSLHIHAEELPELEQTCATIMKKHSNPSMLNLNVADIRFPSPDPESPRTPSRSKPRRYSEGRRFSMRGYVQPEKPVPSGISKADALAIINDFGPYSNSLVISPYEVVPPVGYANRPRSMMDDRTASEVARLRSKNIRDRDNWTHRRGSFNDRGGIPGKNLRPGSICSDTPPPMPSLPVSAHQNSDQGDWQSSSSPAPRPPSHSPRPSYVELDHTPKNAAPVSSLSSHSPQPSTAADPWAAQALAWKERRKSAGEMLKKNSGEYFRDQHDSDEEAIEDEQSYPVISPQSYGLSNGHGDRSGHLSDHRGRGNDPRNQAWPVTQAHQAVPRAHREQQRPLTADYSRQRSIPRDTYEYPVQQSPILDSWRSTAPAAPPPRSPQRSPVRQQPQTPSQSPIPIPPRSPLRNSVTDQSFRNSFTEQSVIRSREGSPTKSVLERASMFETQSQSDAGQYGRQQTSPNPSYPSGSPVIRRRPVPQSPNGYSPNLNQTSPTKDWYGFGQNRPDFNGFTTSPAGQSRGHDLWSANSQSPRFNQYPTSPALDYNYNHNYNRSPMTQFYSPSRF